MTAKITWLPAMLWLIGSSALAQALAAPQGQGRPDSNQLVVRDEAQAAANPAVKQTYEDIEIMRRLLTNKLEELYSSRTPGIWNHPMPYRRWFDPPDPLGLQQRNSVLVNPGVATGAPQTNYHLGQPYQDSNITTPYSVLLQNSDPFGNAGWLEELYSMGQSHPFHVEGCYVEGHGVVYTVTLPPPHGKTRVKSVKPQPKPLSDWERVRKQLRGEKEPDQAKQAPAETQEQTLTDVILSNLFENGHHFDRLGPNDKLTVVITFRPMEQPGPQVAAANNDNNPSPSTTPSSVEAAITAITRAGLPGAASTESAAKSPSTAHDYLLLGDLHLRQGQGKAALDAYRRALELSPEAGDSNALAQLRTLHQKLAQAYLSTGDLENARKEFDELEKLHKRQTTKHDSAAKPDEAKLPAKLIISAPKKLLDQVGAGKITLEEFKKGVTIEHLRFPKPRSDSPSSDNK